MLRPFTLHEAAFLVATEPEWAEYLEIGREGGIINLIGAMTLGPERSSANFQRRLSLEAAFWERIQDLVTSHDWEATRISNTLGEQTLSARAVRLEPNPFMTQIAASFASGPSGAELMFEAVPAHIERRQQADRVAEAIRWMRSYIAETPNWPNMDVGQLDDVIRKKFKHYNFLPGTITNIRKKAGGIGSPGPKPQSSFSS